MADREKVINGLYETIDVIHSFVPKQYWYDTEIPCRDAIALLKAQEKATIEPKRIDLDDETKAWLDKMDAVDALGNIADICMDWDGYRTADGLGGLVNEIWAYARYCADRLLKAQEAVKPRVGHDGWYRCGGCNNPLASGERVNSDDFLVHPWPHYCEMCGQAVKWE